MQQRVTELQIDALGPLSLRRYTRDDADINQPATSTATPVYTIGASSQFLFQRAATIYGGAREVQKNIIAKTAFRI
jgi:hypothetical protein